MQDLTHTLSKKESKVLLMLHKHVTYSSVHANNKNICFFNSIKKICFLFLCILFKQICLQHHITLKETFF